MLRIVLVVVLLATFCVGQDYDHVPDFDWDEVTSLDEYVHRDDGYWSYTHLDTVYLEQATVYVLNMTSQKWTDESYASQSVWWHWMIVAVPFELRTNEHALMAIMGGSNRNHDEPPGQGDLELNLFAQIANDTGVVAAYTRMIPNQPITFTNDPEQRSRSEDDVIAWTWRTYLDEDVPREVILRHPMTKAAKRGLDTVNDFMKTVVPESNIDKFFIGGGSKRGWTTWSLGAVDTRIVGMLPLVFSLLNIDESIMAHYQALEGGWSFAFRPYHRVNLTLELHNPRTQDIWDSEDVFRFRSRLTMPKYLVSATGDEFFLNQDSHFWWNGMPGPLHHYMVSNAEHTLAPHYLKIYDCVVSFMLSIIDNIPFPETSWQMGETENSEGEGEGGWIRFFTDPPPRTDEETGEFDIHAWRAVTLPNNTRRDYRLASGYPDTWIQPVRWWEDELEVEDEDGEFYHYTEQIEDEWVGHLIEGVWDGPEDHRIYLTSQVNIVPNTFPVEPCYGDECYGELV